MNDILPGVSLSEDEKDILRSWRQGDYTLDAREFPMLFVNENGSIDVAWEDVEGWVVLTQTCDIVNFVEGRDLVAVAPLVKAKPGLMQAVATGTTPAAAQIENLPGENLVVDLTKLCVVQKKALAGMRRAIGFNSDETRCTFAQTLERRYGRFAFPDALSDGPLTAIRNQSKDKHKKNSDSGRVYRSLRCIRVSASPDFNTRGAEIQFLAVLDEEARLEATTTEIKKELNSIAASSKFNWPEEFERAVPLFRIVTPDSISAREWFTSQQIDLDFLSPLKDP
ncbi:hypothetical protein [Rhizobium etli]|uniref:hypothetical protein n=1 Tax=Rhizobium etli TaxID=29449 RepID=UPI000383920B|nr:hypothetical protein [Rhizobium etli]AGS25480.1 hypothetical protein REMIM1_PE00394 [Rhizobium etli bv. mimosae str. Mim1]